MWGIQRMVVLIIVAELLVCGYLAARQLGQHQPVLPQVVFDDPLLAADLSALAKAARGGNSRDWQQLGEGLLGQGFYAEAEPAFRRAVELDAKNAMAQFSLAYCIDRTGRIAESTREYMRAAEIAQPSKSPIGSRRHCLYQVGRNALRESQPAEAERVFRKIERYFPAAYQLAKLRVRSGRSSEALPVIDNVLKYLPRSLKFNSLRLHALEELGRLKDAAESARMLERSESLVPLDFGTAFVEPLQQRQGIDREVAAFQKLPVKGSLNRLAEKLDELLVVLEPTSHPEKYQLRKTLVEVEFQRKNSDRMLESIQRLHVAGMSDVDLLQMEGAAYALQGAMPRAVEVWQRALRLSPNVPLHKMLAKYYDEQGETALRDQHLGEAALLEVKLNYWNNQIAAAQQSAHQARKIAPQNAQVWFYSAQIERALGNLEGARSGYTRCVELNPQHGRAIRELKSLAET